MAECGGPGRKKLSSLAVEVKGASPLITVWSAAAPEINAGGYFVAIDRKLRSRNALRVRRKIDGQLSPSDDE